MAKKAEEKTTDVPWEGSTSVDKPKERTVANLQMNFFEQYGSQVAQTAIRGRLLKFSKGDWLAGRDEEEVSPGTRLVANMSQLVVGWVKWADNRPEQQIMGLLEEGYVAPQRDTLGDTDREKWEVGADGTPRDPWQFTNYLILKDVGTDGTDDDNIYTFTTSSRGGIGCVGDLCKVYGKQMRQKPDEFPIVELGVDSYKHPNPEFGRIKIPTMTVVGWEAKSHFGD